MDEESWKLEEFFWKKVEEEVIGCYKMKSYEEKK